MARAAVMGGGDSWGRFHLPGHTPAPGASRFPAGSAPAAATGWRWLFSLRRTDAAGGPRGNAQHPDRRSPKLARVEAVLFVAEGPLSPRKLAQHALLADAAEAGALIEQLNLSYDHAGSAFRIERVSTGYQMLTRAEFAPWLDRLHQRNSELKLSPPALETLAIIAYRQPITRADVEAVRGVQSTEMLKQLLERGLVKIAGEDESLGRPYLYGTTRQFLELFGLRSLDDLPLAEQLRSTTATADGRTSTTPGESPSQPAGSSGRDVMP
ncbi:MAG: SMC-Scp complex subunit ScpB [Planctomycetales bacterium]